MNEIINTVYSQEDLYDCFEGIQERLSLDMNNNRYKYYRILITEVPKEEHIG